MGNSQSTTTNIVTNASMSMVNEFVSTNIAKTSATSVNTQTFTLNIGVIDNCPLSLGQKIESKTVAISKLENNRSASLASSLQATLSSALKNSTEMVNGLAAATGGNEQDTNNNIQTTINQSIQNRITDTNINEVVASSVNTQTMTLNIAACQNSPIQANQGIVSNVIAQNILTQISNDIVNNSVIASATTDVTNSTSMKNQGLNDLVDSMGKAISSIIGSVTGPIGAAYIACAIVCCVCCAALLYFMMSPAGQEAASKASNVGANFAKSKM